jgi:cellulose synthase/poly-beta-1,6-N-acetylglucosamine synthase-like glycosyltransferase
MLSGFFAHLAYVFYLYYVVGISVALQAAHEHKVKTGPDSGHRERDAKTQRDVAAGAPMRLSVTEGIFWVSVAALAFSYAVYPLVVFLLAARKQTWRDLSFLLARQNRRRTPREEFAPSVALLVAAYNEEGVIEGKIRNTLELEYPAEKMEFLLGLDAPTDATAECAGRILHPAFRLMPFAVRRKKLAVIRDLAERTTADLLIFSDANTLLEADCLQRLARHADAEVGAVCGELRLTSPGGGPKMESLYWRYEVALKFLANRLNCVLGANGAVHAVRRELFRADRHWIVEDFQVPMEIRYSGRRVVYDPEAVGTEEAAPSLGAEFRRKVCIGAGDFQTLFSSLHFLNPLKGMPAFAYFSHKVLRWLGPEFLLSAWVASAVVAPQHALYAGGFAAQTIFYLLALAGYAAEQRGRHPKLLGLPLYFSAVNLALLLGLLRLLGGRQATTWSATPRTVPLRDEAERKSA